MTPAIVLQALIQYGPAILPLIQEVSNWVKDGKKEVTSDDIKQLIEFGQKTAADYLK